MPKKQYGVLPYFRYGNKTKVIMITSRIRQKWIFPKGDRITGKSKRATALQEAFEEAGLQGQLDEEGTLRLTIKSHGEKIELILYPMRVEKMLRLWPEHHQRKRIIVSCNKAEMLVAWPKLKGRLKSWHKTLVSTNNCVLPVAKHDRTAVYL